MPSSVAKDAINEGLELISRRWSARILWELRSGEPMTFRALQEACDEVSPTVLNQRLKELREAGVVEHAEGYALTAEGRALLVAFEPFSRWAVSWFKRRQTKG